jgi:predicted alpha/beta hydrolase
MSGMLERSIAAADGYRLCARLFLPSTVATGAVLLVPAMGVPQSHYTALARWLAERGYAAATFDYRGTGRSRPPRLRGLSADILDWARLDCDAVLTALEAQAPGRPLSWIGHSLGGQILPFVPGHQRLAKAILIASGNGYWRQNAAPLRRRVWLLWYLIAPLAVSLAGYFPGRRLRMVGELPGRLTQAPAAPAAD